MANKVDADLEQMRNAADETDNVISELRKDSQSIDVGLFNLAQNFEGDAADNLMGFRNSFAMEAGMVQARLGDIVMALRQNIANYSETDSANAEGITGASGGSGSLADALRDGGAAREGGGFHSRGEVGGGIDSPGAARPDGEGFLSRAEANNEAPRRGAEPEEVTEWWDNLSEEQQQHILENRPENIAELDGIPFDVRNEANTALLESELSDIDTRLSDIRSQMDAMQPPEGQMDAARYRELAQEGRELTQRQDALENLQSKLDSSTQLTDQPHLLLAFDTEADNVIMSVGDPGTSAYIATYVPGTGMSMLDTDRFNTELGRSRSLVDSAELEYGVGNDTAVIMYANFENPQTVFDITNVTGGFTGEAGEAHYVTNGAEGLATFTEGLASTSDYQSHTAIGHSAGGAAVGTAAALDNFQADNLIYVGSAGAGDGVYNASDLSVDNVFSTAAPSDFINVPGLGSIGETHVHGGNVVNPSFGADFFGSDNRGNRFQMGENHRGYFDFSPDGADGDHNRGLEGMTGVMVHNDPRHPGSN
ncbi:alpha/beta hydrolase [Natronoglycomyces albus]|uniref:DUF1023 domain-containing protein n=1 Tax=Natronoglycomyces albus TaxID=2811108 RepID=A0A895XN89_9ACTN|nr:alpha/beta hydrolase [Natronoglycomyces albus]QSB04859.1 hypothetical protein JQS30_13985 [Natronoglycomyces albus]